MLALPSTVSGTLARVDPGFRTDHILTFNLPVPEKRLTQPEQIVAYYRQLVERIESLPGVIRAEAATGMPLQGTNFGMPFTIEGKPVADPSARPGAGFQMVTPGFFQTFGSRWRKAGPSPIRTLRAVFGWRL